MTCAVGQDYWDTAYEDLPLAYSPGVVQFKELFDRYLTPGGTCFEVGCYPGSYLIYLGKRFDYTVSGIDATPFVLSRLPKHLAQHRVRVGRLYHGDFLAFEARRTYDLVCSFGFIEHFADFQEVIVRHIRLVKRPGTLVLACPNLRGIQYMLHRLLDPVNLQRHVLAAMDFARWEETLEASGMTVLYQGYYRTADFWVDTPRQGFLAKVAINSVRKIAQEVDSRTNWPNPLLSPYMISFSRKV